MSVQDEKRSGGAGPVLTAAEESEDVLVAVRGANPFIGLTPRQVVGAGGRWAQGLLKRPNVLGRAVRDWASAEAEVVTGRSGVAPDPKDHRFTDPAWTDSPLWRRVAQSYLVTRDAVLGSVDQLDLDEKSADRARFALMQVTEASAPTNNLFTNPKSRSVRWLILEEDRS